MADLTLLQREVRWKNLCARQSGRVLPVIRGDRQALVGWASTIHVPRNTMETVELAAGGLRQMRSFVLRNQRHLVSSGLDEEIKGFMPATDEEMHEFDIFLGKCSVIDPIDLSGIGEGW